MTVKLIQQRTPNDCAVCCMAMHTGASYETVLERVGDHYEDGIGLKNVGGALERLGLSSRYESGEPVGDFSWMSRPYALSAEYFRALAWGRAALITVKSKNRDTWHMVYWDGGGVWDPSNLETFKELHPEELVLFRTTGSVFQR